MDMSRYSRVGSPEYKLRQLQKAEYRLRKHCKAIREYHVSVAVIMLAIEGIPVDLSLRGEPMPGFAKECLDELGLEGNDIWACSTQAGGIWTVEQRHMLRYGEER